MSVPHGLLTMDGVGLECVEQPLQTSLIIVVFLAFDDDLLSAIDELVTSLRGEVIV